MTHGTVVSYILDDLDLSQRLIVNQISRINLLPQKPS